MNCDLRIIRRSQVRVLPGVVGKLLASKPLCLLAFFDVTLGRAFVPNLCQIAAHALSGCLSGTIYEVMGRSQIERVGGREV